MKESKDSPSALLREQSIDSAKIAAWGRKLLKQHMSELSKTLNLSTTTMRDRSAAAAEIVEIMKAMNDAVYKAAPFLMVKGAGGGESSAPVTQESIMAEIIQGRKAK